MKKILVTVVLGIATVAAAQTAAQPAQPSQGQAAQPSASTTQGPVIKDPAEYNAYVGAINQKDPAARLKISAEAMPVPMFKHRGPRYTPIAKRQDKPNAIAWCRRKVLRRSNEFFRTRSW